MSFDKLKMTFITFWGLLIQPPCIIGAESVQQTVSSKYFSKLNLMLSKILETDLKISFNSEIKSSKTCKLASIPLLNGSLTIKKNSATQINDELKFL